MSLDQLNGLELLIFKELTETRSRVSIAEKLDISYDAVQSKIKTIYRKLKISSHTEFLARYVEARSLDSKLHTNHMQEITKVRKQMKRPPLKPGFKNCLRCERKFKSPDISLIRTCDLCKSVNQKLKDD